MKIYFAGSIMGGRERQQEYYELIEYCKQFGEVLTEHIGQENVAVANEQKFSEREDEHVYIRDTEWIKECDVIVAEVSVPSLGVGYEIGFGESLGKDIVCLYCNSAEKKLSYMLSGNSKNNVIRYDTLEEVKAKLKVYFDEKKNFDKDLINNLKK